MPSSLVVVVTETLVSILVILHRAPTITPPLRSVTLPEIRALSVCAWPVTAARSRSAKKTGHFIETLPMPLRAAATRPSAKAVRRISFCVRATQAVKLTGGQRGRGLPRVGVPLAGVRGFYG